jgi:HPt (histidine-containing phosphotransfer) domain-containing protein
VTADAVGGGILRAREAGFDSHVLKPVSRATLVGTLVRFLPPTEEPAPIQDALLPGPALPSLPGLDLQVALHNHNGRGDLLIRLLGELLEHYGDAGRRMRELVTGNRIDEAARLAHNLHGVAGSFGAERLRQAASALEQILETEAEPPDAALGRFEQALTEALESAARITRGEIELPGDARN